MRILRDQTISIDFYIFTIGFDVAESAELYAIYFLLYSSNCKKIVLQFRNVNENFFFLLDYKRNYSNGESDSKGSK